MAFVALLDANVLWPAAVRCTLLRIAPRRLYQPAWTHEILAEMSRSIKRERPDLPPDLIDRTVQLMPQHFPQALVDGYEDLMPAMRNDAKDRHVLAAAVHRGAGVIVTWNTADFPYEARKPYDIGPQTPDEFLLDLWDLSAEEVIAALREQAEALKNPPQTVPDILSNLARSVPNFSHTVLGCGLIELEE